MKNILFLKASPRGSRSHSLAVAEAFIDAYRQYHQAVEVVPLDLFALDLPPFDGLRLQAKYNILHDRPHSQTEAEAWKVVEEWINQFKAADKYVLATAMWNFSVPYRLKQYLDIILQPGYTFSYSPESGYQGLVTGKPIFITYARGGEYPIDSPAGAMDFQRPYLEFILRFIGFKEIRRLIIEPTLAQGPEVARSRRQSAIEQARKMAESF